MGLKLLSKLFYTKKCIFIFATIHKFGTFRSVQLATVLIMPNNAKNIQIRGTPEQMQLSNDCKLQIRCGLI